MPVHFGWDDEHHTIMRYRFEGHWTWSELRTIFEQGVILNNEVVHRVDTIADLTLSKGLPAQVVSEFPRLVTLPQLNTGLIVIVGGGSLIPYLLKGFKTVYRKGAEKYVHVNILEEAYRLIMTDRTTPRSHTN